MAKTRRRNDKLSKRKVSRRRYSKHRVSRKKKQKRVSKRRYTKKFNRQKGGMDEGYVMVNRPPPPPPPTGGFYSIRETNLKQIEEAIHIDLAKLKEAVRNNNWSKVFSNQLSKSHNLPTGPYTPVLDESYMEEYLRDFKRTWGNGVIRLLTQGGDLVVIEGELNHECIQACKDKKEQLSQTLHMVLTKEHDDNPLSMSPTGLSELTDKVIYHLSLYPIMEFIMKFMGASYGLTETRYIVLIGKEQVHIATYAFICQSGGGCSSQVLSTITENLFEHTMLATRVELEPEPAPAGAEETEETEGMKRLMEVGFDREKAEEALTMYDGDVKKAIEYLLKQGEADLEPEPEPMSDTGPIKIGLIRHSVREDNDPTDQVWSDKIDRPYDPPISFKLPHELIGVSLSERDKREGREKLPMEKAIELKDYNFTRIISSPFRRCLQTAAIIAKNLGIKTIDVDKGIGEAMSMVSRVGGKRDNFNYLSPKQMNEIIQEASDGEAKIGRVSGVDGVFGQVDVSVIESNFNKLKDEILNNPLKQNVLLVTHGDVIGQTLNIVNGETVLEVDYCAWIIYEKGDTQNKLKLVAKNGVESMKLS
tara:strand:- start:1506 stop:3275 length:1770 start_codon:yes stop_codon:yes gene_type:complete